MYDFTDSYIKEKKSLIKKYFFEECKPHIVIIDKTNNIKYPITYESDSPYVDISKIKYPILQSNEGNELTENKFKYNEVVKYPFTRDDDDDDYYWSNPKPLNKDEDELTKTYSDIIFTDQRVHPNDHDYNLNDTNINQLNLWAFNKTRPDENYQGDPFGDEYHCTSAKTKKYKNGEKRSVTIGGLKRTYFISYIHSTVNDRFFRKPIDESKDMEVYPGIETEWYNVLHFGIKSLPDDLFEIDFPNVDDCMKFLEENVQLTMWGYIYIYEELLNEPYVLFNDDEYDENVEIDEYDKDLKQKYYEEEYADVIDEYQQQADLNEYQKQIPNIFDGEYIYYVQDPNTGYPWPMIYNRNNNTTQEAGKRFNQYDSQYWTRKIINGYGQIEEIPLFQ